MHIKPLTIINPCHMLKLYNQQTCLNLLFRAARKYLHLNRYILEWFVFSSKKNDLYSARPAVTWFFGTGPHHLKWFLKSSLRVFPPLKNIINWLTSFFSKNSYENKIFENFTYWRSDSGWSVISSIYVQTRPYKNERMFERKNKMRELMLPSF